MRCLKIRPAKHLKVILLVQAICLFQMNKASFLIHNPKIQELITSTGDDELDQKPNKFNVEIHEEANANKPLLDQTSGQSHDKRLFVIELLKMLHEQYSVKKASAGGASKKQDTLGRQLVMAQLMSAISADGDMRRLVDWLQNSFNLASVGELTTQFVVSKLGSVNCAALLKPDSEESLIPRFLLFNEHYTDVPFELPLKPSATECIANGRFDPQRKTIVLIHGFLAGYTLLDGITNIKNRLLDLNRLVNERALRVFLEASRNNGSYVLTDDIESKVKSQQQNVIIVDWFQGANPVPRSRYIRAAVNSQVVGELIARFLSTLITQCKTPPNKIQIIAHSLGCHVAGFTGKAMLAKGQQIGKITHLDPIGLCFGRLFSQPKFRLSPNDASQTQAVHVSLNLFDNPLDGVQSNFLVNGGRDQIGCGGQSELRNSTTSSVALLYDSNAKFAPCSHLRALALFEDDLSSEPEQCQIVGYKCANYERFLAGKCGRCDAMNSECRLMSLPPIMSHFRRLPTHNSLPTAAVQQFHGNKSSSAEQQPLLSLVSQHSNGSIAWLVHDKDINQKIGNAIAAKLRLSSTALHQSHSKRRFDSRSMSRIGTAAATTTGERLVQTLDKIRAETVNALAGGWSNLKSAEYKLSSLINPTALQFASPMAEETVIDTEAIKNALDPAGGGNDQYEVPIGSQPIPSGSYNAPLYFVGTGPISPYCVNYYQFRVLIAESRIRRLLEAGALRQKQSYQSSNGGNVVANMIEREATMPSDSLHMTIKLTDSAGRFFKGFTLQESSRSLAHVPRTESLLTPPGKAGEPMVELTLLLNTTRPEPTRITETIISYYFHPIVLADLVELNYMSNISPEVRAKYSSLLCPVAINDKHQLVRYIECNKIDSI